MVPIEVPPLRDRLEDVPTLVAHFAEQIAAGAGVPGRRFAEDAIMRLQARSWPGNIRELRNGIERALILASGKTVTGADIDRLLPPEAGRGQSFESFREETERSFITEQLRQHDWNISETARAMKIPRSNLYKKMERYGLKEPE